MSNGDRSGIGKALGDNWRPLAVIAVGLILTVYLAWRLQPEQPYLPRYQPTDPKAAGYQAGGRDCSPASLTAVRDVGKRTAKSDDCADKAEDYRLKADDLIQQTRAADAAQSQARSAYEQGWLALWATLGGLWTLIAAGLAAAYARDAARESKRSADAAEAAIIEAQRIGEAQTAAFLSPKLIRVMPHGTGDILGDANFLLVDVENLGASPASNVTISGQIDMTVGDSGHSVIFSSDSADSRSISIRDPQAIQLAFGENKGDFIAAILAGSECKVNGELAICYVDIFDNKWLQPTTFDGQWRYNGIFTGGLVIKSMGAREKTAQK